MRTKRHWYGLTASAADVMVILILTGFAAKRAPARFTSGAIASEAPASGLVLEYKMPAGRVLRYMDRTETREVSDVMGETIESQTTSTSAYSFQAKGWRGTNHLLGVTVDDMNMNVTSSVGDLSPDLTSVRGRSFDMVLSPLGVEVDVSGAESITYEFASGPRNIASGFKTFFPDLPGKPIKVGDSWPSNYIIDEKSGTKDIRMEFQSFNTLEGFETVDGMECARITSMITGKISGSGKRPGHDMLFAGTHKATEVWSFAFKEGIYVRSTSEIVIEMITSVSGVQATTIPSSQMRKGEVKLAGR